MERREGWDTHACRLGTASSAAIAGIGGLYVLAIGLWLVVEAAPREPIGDPYLAVMEVLTVLSAFAILGFVVALQRFAGAVHPLRTMGALVVGSLGAGLTVTVHFVQLTAVRQLWRAGQVADYRLVWPSTIFAVEYAAWDL